jgi:hypothetical protein
MKREVKGLYAQCFQFAFDVAKKAELALRHELGDDQLNYIQFGYLAGKEGLLAGEKLWLDLKRMEMAFHEQNQREYELTKHVSLLQVDPLALVQLRATGACTVRLTEDAFDLDCPGHYFRRMKSVALSIPCVAGPQTSVNCTLTLMKSSVRTSTSIEDGYARVDAEDGRFNDYYGSLQSVALPARHRTTAGCSTSIFATSGMFRSSIRERSVVAPGAAGRSQPGRTRAIRLRDHQRRDLAPALTRRGKVDVP